LIRQFLAQLHATSPLEVVAVLLGLAYVLLMMRRNRLGWIAGGLGSAVYVYLAARARLPMQAALNVFYVLMAVYGWYTWVRMEEEEGGRVRRWPLRVHVLALAAIVIVSLASAQLLARETRAAWPRLDSLTTWASLFATWLVTRMQLDNWLYWIVIDAVVAYLFAAQGLLFTAALFTLYTVVAVFGYRAWLQKYRQAA
jgi:nicotinamide mononucleotide transporter